MTRFEDWVQALDPFHFRRVNRNGTNGDIGANLSLGSVELVTGVRATPSQCGVALYSEWAMADEDRT
jgi:hypothetical protein